MKTNPIGNSQDEIEHEDWKEQIHLYRNSQFIGGSPANGDELCAGRNLSTLAVGSYAAIAGGLRHDHCRLARLRNGRRERRQNNNEVEVISLN